MFQPEEESEDTEENRRIRREKEEKQWEMLRSNPTGSLQVKKVHSKISRINTSLRQTGPTKREEWMTILPDTKKVSLDFGTIKI